MSVACLKMNIYASILHSVIHFCITSAQGLGLGFGLGMGLHMDMDLDRAMFGNCPARGQGGGVSGVISSVGAGIIVC